LRLHQMTPPDLIDGKKSHEKPRAEPKQNL